MTGGRSPGVPSAGIPMVYSANETEPAKPRRLATSMDDVFGEFRDGRYWIGHGNARGSFSAVSFSGPEFDALKPFLLKMYASRKEETK